MARAVAGAGLVLARAGAGAGAAVVDVILAGMGWVGTEWGWHGLGRHGPGLAWGWAGLSPRQPSPYPAWPMPAQLMSVQHGAGVGQAGLT